MAKQSKGAGSASTRLRTYTGTQEQQQFEAFRQNDEIMTYTGTATDDTKKAVRVNNEAQLSRYLDREREGAIAQNIRRLGLATPNFDGDGYTISKAQVQYTAKQFVYETIDAGTRSNVDSDYAYDYRIENQLYEARESLNESWSTFDVDNLSQREKEWFINTQKAYEARAILESARIGNVKLTDAQVRRLEISAQGRYTDLLMKRKVDRTRGISMNAREKRQYLEELRRNDII